MPLRYMLVPVPASDKPDTPSSARDSRYHYLFYLAREEEIVHDRKASQARCAASPHVIGSGGCVAQQRVGVKFMRLKRSNGVCVRDDHSEWRYQSRNDNEGWSHRGVPQEPYLCLL